MVTILDEDGNQDEVKSERINNILSKDIRLFDYIRDHLDEAIYYGSYYSMLKTKRDEKGHLKFYIVGLYDPISVIIKRTIKEDETEEEFVAIGEDGDAYIIPSTECFYLGTPNMRLINDLKEGYGGTGYKSPGKGKQENRNKK